MKEEKEVFRIGIEVDDEGVRYKATGAMTSGNVKLMVAELELIKPRLLSDLEKSLDNESPTHRFEFP